MRLSKILFNLAYYTSWASSILTIGGSMLWDIFQFDQCRKEKWLFEESICNLTLQQDKYLQKALKASIFITGIVDTLSSFNLLVSLVDQVMLLPRDITRNDIALAPRRLLYLLQRHIFIQGDLENL